MIFEKFDRRNRWKLAPISFPFATTIAVRYHQNDFLGDSSDDKFASKLFGMSALLRRGAIFKIISTTVCADNASRRNILSATKNRRAKMTNVYSIKKNA